MKIRERVSKNMVFFFVLILNSFLVRFAFSFPIQTPETTVVLYDNPARNNPFLFPSNNRLVPGRSFSMDVDEKFKDSIQYIELRKPGSKSYPLDGHVTETNADGKRGFRLDIRIPTWRNIKKYFYNPKFFEGILSSHEAALVLGYSAGPTNPAIEIPFSVEIPEPLWAWFWAIMAIVVSTVLGWAVFRKKNEGNSYRENWFVQIIKFPLRLALTPDNRYSLSLTQLMIWSYVTIFGISFVWKMTETFLDITPQVLLLLGIGGGTAAISKLQTVARLQNIPPYIRSLLKTDRTPRLADLISTSDDQPSIVKFQMLVFTIIIAGTVFKEIFHGFTFPVLSDGLIALMGISSAVYIGTDLSKTVTNQALNDAINNFMQSVENEKNLLNRETLFRKDELSPALKTKLSELRETINAYLQ